MNPIRTAVVVITLFSLMVLAGCAVPHRNFLQNDRMECEQFGFQPGTDRYADCLLQLDKARHQTVVHRH